MVLISFDLSPPRGREPKESTGCHYTFTMRDVTPLMLAVFSGLPFVIHTSILAQLSFTQTQCGFSWDRSVGRSVLSSLSPNSVVSVGGGVGRNQRSLQPRDKMYIHRQWWPQRDVSVKAISGQGRLHFRVQFNWNTVGFSKCNMSPTVGRYDLGEKEAWLNGYCLTTIEVTWPSILSFPE